MKSVIVGTAGHIDHGKSALVRALTGTDPDRLEEEKRRGITIDIGFAHLELRGDQWSVVSDQPAKPQTVSVAGNRDIGVTRKTAGSPPDHRSPITDHSDVLRLGFVDVPGHERFVRNMLAGAGGIDVVLLVIGADEGIKPQTREHFDIVRLLNIPRGIAVLTKSDLVDNDTLDVVRMEVEDFLRGSFLEGAPVVPVSSKTGAGLDDLKRELARVAADVRGKDAHALFRLPIDRCFVMKGFGTVVTGTLIAGSIQKEDEVEILPSRQRARVRGVQVHGKPADSATAGQRTALNLAGVAAEDIVRGMTLTPPDVLQTTMRADVAIALLKTAKPLRDRARVHFHSYTTETIAEVALIADARVAHDPSKTAPLQQLAPGEEAFASLRFADPVLLLPGDRFILRQFSPVVTMGGGVVVDALPPRTKVSRDERLLRFTALAGGTPAQRLAMRVARQGGAGLTMREAIAETGMTRADIESALPDNSRSFVRFGDILVGSATIVSLQHRMVEWLADFHTANPLAPGMGKEELRERTGTAPEVFSALLDRLVADKKIEVAGEVVRSAGHGVAMKDEEAASQRQIEHAFASAGLKVPALKDVLAGLKVDRARAQKIVTLLLRDRVLVKLSDDLVFHRDALESLRKAVAAQKPKSPKIDVAKFKDLTGVSRKYAIPLLEWLDRERVTRRVGDERIIL